MLRFKFWAAVYAARASLPLFANALAHGDVWLVFWWATALAYSIAVALFVVRDWLNWRGVRKRVRSGDGKLCCLWSIWRCALRRQESCWSLIEKP